MTVTIDGRRMTGQKVAARRAADAAGRYEKATLDKAARARIGAARDYIEHNWLNDDAPLMYAFNTGVGLFKDVRIPIADMAHYQDQIIRAHATGRRRAFRRPRSSGPPCCCAPMPSPPPIPARRCSLMDRPDRLPQRRPPSGHPAEGLRRRLGRPRPSRLCRRRDPGLSRRADRVQGAGLPAPEAARARGLGAGLPDGRQGGLGDHQRLDRVARHSGTRRRGCAAHPEARRHRPRHVARGPARRARGLRPASSCGAAPSRPGQNRAQRPAHRRRFEALLRGRPRDPLSRRGARSRQAGPAARPGRLLPALRPPGPRARRRCAALHRGSARRRDERGDRQSADVRGRRWRATSPSPAVTSTAPMSRRAWTSCRSPWPTSGRSQNGGSRAWSIPA